MLRPLHEDESTHCSQISMPKDLDLQNYIIINAFDFVYGYISSLGKIPTQNAEVETDHGFSLARKNISKS